MFVFITSPYEPLQLNVIVINKLWFFTDMWAIGAILAELFTLTPLFPGETYVLNFTFGSINLHHTTFLSLDIIVICVVPNFFILWFYHSETDQLYKICTVLGTPDHSVWPEGMNLPRSSSFQFFQVKWVLSTFIGLMLFNALIFHFFFQRFLQEICGSLFLMLHWKLLTWLRYSDGVMLLCCLVLDQSCPLHEYKI